MKDFIVYLEETKTLPEDVGAECLDYLVENMLRMPLIKELNELWFQREISSGEFTDHVNVCSEAYYEDSEWTVHKQGELKKLWFENIENAINTNKNTFALVNMNWFAYNSEAFNQWIEENGFELKGPK